MLKISTTAMLLFATLAANAADSAAKATWTFRGFDDENCKNEFVSVNGTEERTCADAPKRLQSYRFSATTDTETNETFSVRLYEGEECFYLSNIDDVTRGSCQAFPFRSFNVFSFVE